MENLKKVLVTGASGFIGSNLVKELVKKGFFVNAFVHDNLGCLEEVYNQNKEKINLIQGHILDFEKINKALEGVEFVFHFAGISSVEECVKNPKYCFETNFIGTKILLENSRNKNIKKIILASSSLIYLKISNKINEDSEIILDNPYTISKRDAELFALKEFQDNKLPILIIRMFNIYGEMQSVKAVIPKLICKVIKEESIDINCSSKRDFLYITDAVDAIIKLSEIDLSGEIINLGKGEPNSLHEISEILKREFGENLNINYLNKNSPEEIFSCDNSKLKNLINWSPIISIEEGIKKTIDYIKNNLSKYNLVC